MRLYSKTNRLSNFPSNLVMLVTLSHKKKFYYGYRHQYQISCFKKKNLGLIIKIYTYSQIRKKIGISCIANFSPPLC